MAGLPRERAGDHALRVGCRSLTFERKRALFPDTDGNLDRFPISYVELECEFLRCLLGLECVFTGFLERKSPAQIPGSGKP